jgi:hypothetical protein
VKKPTPTATRHLLSAAGILSRARGVPLAGAAVPTTPHYLRSLAKQLQELACGAPINAVFDPPKRGRPSLKRENWLPVLAYWDHRAKRENRKKMPKAERAKSINDAVAACNNLRQGKRPLSPATIAKYARTWRKQLMAAADFAGVDSSALVAFLDWQSRGGKRPK